MTITSTHADNAVVLRISGRLDAITAPEFESTCQQCINPQTRKVVLDFDGVEYISSAGLRAILLVGKTVKSGSGALVQRLAGHHQTRVGDWWLLCPVPGL